MPWYKENPDLTNDPTYLEQRVESNEQKAHTHANKVTLDNFGEDVDGNPTFNGNSIGQSQFVNVKEYGAVGDGVTDDSTAIQSAIDYVGGLGGGTVYLPVGVYLIGNTLSVSSNIEILGASKEATIIKDHADLGANRLFLIEGTDVDYIKNVSFKNLTFKNGVASTDTYVIGKDGIRTDYVDGFYLKNCKITEIEGTFGVVTKRTKNITVQHCHFYRWTYSAMTCLIECENIKVLDNIFDTALAQNTPQNYTFATGADVLNEGDFYIKNLHIERNKFLNNQRWEGIDCHGGENVWIKDNYIENVRMGIMCSIASGYVANPKLKNFWIEDNVIIQGDGLDNHWGIIVGGEDDGTVSAENIIVRGNKVNGFGTLQSSSIGSVGGHNWLNGIIENNQIENFSQYGVCMQFNNLNVDIINNSIKNMRGSYTLSISGFIAFRNQGNYNVNVKGNKAKTEKGSVVPAYFVYNNNQFMSAQICKNLINGVSTSKYYNNNWLSVESDVEPTLWIIQKFGDKITNTAGVATHTVSTPIFGFGSLNANIMDTCDMTSGLNELTLLGATNWQRIPTGMNITIVGAGFEGANLKAMVIEKKGKTLTLDKSAETTVAGADITFQALTITAH